LFYLHLNPVLLNNLGSLFLISEHMLMINFNII